MKGGHMARASWFEGASTLMNLDEYVSRMESWQQALADGLVQAGEVRQQAKRVEDMLRKLEPKLSDELHEELTQILYELAVLYGMQKLAESTLE
jgi:hypothetical protein